jgi:hypothetical protein
MVEDCSFHGSVKPARPQKQNKKTRVRLRFITLHGAWLVASALLAGAGLDILRFSFFEKLPDNSCK